MEAICYSETPPASAGFFAWLTHTRKMEAMCYSETAPACAGFLFGLLLYPEDGSEMLLRKASCLCWFLAWLTLIPWRWRRYVTPKHLLLVLVSCLTYSYTLKVGAKCYSETPPACAGFLPGLLLCPEDEFDMFLRYVGLSQNYKSVKTRRPYSS
jgi:hypothetical protein